MSGPDGGAPVPVAAAPVPPADAPQDTPPMAGPTPAEECEEKDGINCPEKLALSRATLCVRSDLSVNPLLTGSQALATTVKPMASGALVDVEIVTYKDKAGGDPSDTLAVPGFEVSDLNVSEPDLNPEKPGKQIGVEADGSVLFHLVAGVKTGYYEVRVTGDVDSAVGDLTVENCSAPSEELSSPVDSSVKPVIKY
ncbi:MAG TPA: hypothetical protein VLJ37_09145 [bacterium]|nr:hypothetical protein [bacterium]